MKYLITSFLIAAFSVAVFAQKKNKNDKPYPYGNPVIKHMYTADAAPKVMPDGRVWMVTSVDHEYGGGYSTMHKYHTFSSADMVNWTDHGEIFNVWDALGAPKEPKNEDWALWAPDMVYYKGKYYLYYPVRILFPEHGYDEKKRKTKSYIAVAVSDAPDKHFKVINPKIEGTSGIDPSVFIDDDGQPYLYFGSHKAAKLKENMMELDGDAIRLDVDDEHFMEAIWMHKYNNKYYVSYHAHYGKPIDREKPDDPERLKSTLNWGVSENPMGPFTHGGILNYELGVNVNEGPKLPGYDYVPWRVYQSNHGGIVEYHGTDYLFYHTSALSSWRQDEFEGPGTWTQRSVCIDKIKYNKDGSVIPVQQTLESVAPVKVDQPYEIVLQKEAQELNAKQNEMVFKGIDLGTGYYYFGTKVNSVSGTAKLEVRLDNSDGELLGTIILNESSVTTNNGVAETFLRDAKGKHKIVLSLKAEGDAKVNIGNLRVFAGAPSDLPCP